MTEAVRPTKGKDLLCNKDKPLPNCEIRQHGMLNFLVKENANQGQTGAVDALNLVMKTKNVCIFHSARLAIETFNGCISLPEF